MRLSCFVSASRLGNRESISALGLIELRLNKEHHDSFVGIVIEGGSYGTNTGGIQELKRRNPSLFPPYRHFLLSRNCPSSRALREYEITI